MELGSWSIIQAPSLLALIPLVVYIVLVFRGKSNVSGIIVGIFLAALMLGQNLKAVSVGLAASLGSSTALIGMIIMAGAGLGVLMTEAGVSRTMVYWIVKRIGVNTQTKAKIALIICSIIICGLLGTLGGGNAVIAPILIPIMASLGITPSVVASLFKVSGEIGLMVGPLTGVTLITEEVTGLSYGQLMVGAVLPFSAVWLIGMWIAAKYSLQGTTPTMTPTIAPTTVPTQVPTAAPTVAPTKKTVKASVSKKLIQPVKASENANQLSWNPVKNADGYFIYASACNENGKERKVKKIADIKKRTTTSYTHKNCEKDTWYKYRITAYRIIGKKKTAISKSLELHSLTKGSKTYENPSRVKIRSGKKLSLKAGSTKKIRAQVIVPKGKKTCWHIQKIRYLVSDSSVLTVSKKGKIRAKKAGQATIYAVAQNGVNAKIKVSVIAEK